MVVFRLVQGAAGAAMIPSSQAIMMESFPPAEVQAPEPALANPWAQEAAH